MSCNGCRVLRSGCSDECILRPCLEWIKSPQAQANATLFVSKFFGRSDLMSFVAAVPQPQRPVLFQSLLFEACGRTINPVNGAVGLLSTGNWHICRAAVETVLAGDVITPVAWDAGAHKCMETAASEISEVSPESGESDKGPKLLNLFA
ncbi:LOB domain-containing protein 38 [Salvia divinorum]|uniref:LOB domain-containing protein 38 n=1 Tax=Salvia divinorum TaxID=28513 RepID=A0ABD1I8Q6_SALDI